MANSELKKAPGEGTGPTTHADSRGNIVGRVPSRGERDVFEQAADSCQELNRPTPGPSQEGSRPADARRLFPSWEGLGVGTLRSDCTAFDVGCSMLDVRCFGSARASQGMLAGEGAGQCSRGGCAPRKNQ